MATALVIARLALAVVFLVAAFAKLVDRAGTRQAVGDFGVPRRLARPIASALPFVEIAVAVALVPPAAARWGAVSAIALLGLFVVAIVVNLARGRRPDCRCFGQLQSTPIGSKTILRNLGLAAVASFVAWGGHAQAASPSWLGDVSGAGWAGLAVGLLLLGMAAVQAWFVVNLRGQHGRLLVRVAAVEAALVDEGINVPGGPGLGLPVGSEAPEFSLTGLYGETLTLGSLRAAGHPVMLVFTDPNCGPCAQLMPDIGRWQDELAGQLTIALLSWGSVEENRAKAAEHGVSRVLLQREQEVAQAYQYAGTPSAVIVGADGRIATHLEVGTDGVRDLMARVTGVPQPEPAPAAAGNGQAGAPPAPAGVPIGEPAPSFSLKDLKGRSVRLQDFRGDDTLVLFWNPGCGFCQQMLPDLKAWEADPPSGAPKLVVVSTGSFQDNVALGLKSPVLLDKDFAVASQFGAGGTPMGVLVDAEGKVASEVAAGAPGVWELVRTRSQSDQQHQHQQGAPSPPNGARAQGRS